MAFETFLEQARPRPRGARVVALVASAVGHAALVLGAAALFLRPVVEAAMPKLVPVFLRAPLPPKVAPPAPPAEPGIRQAAAAAPAPRRRVRAPRPPTPAVALPVTTSAAPPTAGVEPVVEQPVEQPAPVAAAPTAPVTAAPTAPVAPTSAAAAPPAPRPRFLPEALASSQKLSGEMPRLPPALARSGTSYVVLAKVCVGGDGQVDSVSIERGAHPAIDAEVRSVLPTWRYRPLLAAGQPVPFCTFLRFEFRAL